MTILVAYASKHGATQQIAERIAQRLRSAGLHAEARPVKEVGDVSGYDAYVIGSAVYFGSWLKDAAAFVRRNRDALGGRPVWLFSSGPLGTGEQYAKLYADAQPKETTELSKALNPRDHRIFCGALDLGRLNFAERAIATIGRSFAPEGDFRDWADVEAWADDIAKTMIQAPQGMPSTP